MIRFLGKFVMVLVLIVVCLLLVILIAEGVHVVRYELRSP